MSSVEIRKAINASDVADQAVHVVTIELQRLLKAKSKVHFALTGGTVGILTLKHLAANEDFLAQDLTKVHIWFGDERYVDADSSDRNANQAKDALLNSLVIPAENIHEFPSKDSGCSVEDSAKSFERELLAQFADGAPSMDLMLLGMGPDGHVASLFPGKEHQTGLIVAELDSPKPPAERLSMSMELINRSAMIVFVVSGIDKAEATEQVHRNAECQLPAAQVHAANQTLWIIDEAAGAAFWSC